MKTENHCVKLPEDKSITGLYNSGDDIMSLNLTAELTEKGKSVKECFFLKNVFPSQLFDCTNIS